MVPELAPGTFFGRTHSSRAVAGITLKVSHYGPEVTIPPHEHESIFFDLVLDGFCSEVVDGRPRPRGPATLAFHPAGEVHVNRWHGGTGRCFHVEVGPEVLDRARAF